MNKPGFTLIELLVVVLIIGILAAIALPQYQRTVEKSRAMKAVVAVRALKDAQEVYYMSNGLYAPGFDGLDIEVTQDLQEFDWSVATFINGRFAAYNSDKKYFIVTSGDFRNDGGRAGILYCCPGSEESIKLCQSLSGGVPADTPSCPGGYLVQ